MTLESIADGAAVSVVSASAVGGFGWWRRQRRRKKADYLRRWERQEAFNEGVRLAMVSTQHHMIYELCNRHLEAGYITTAALDDLDHLMRGYEAMGGDGTAHILQERVHMLPIDNSKEPELLRGSYGNE